MKSQSSHGFAIVIVMLVSAVILTSVVLTTALAAIGSRSSANDERRSYQALLVSESGIDTLAARANAERFLGKGEADEFNLWLSDSGVGFLDFGNGSTALISIIDSVPAATDPSDPDYDPNGFVLRRATARSASLVTEGSSRKTILQEYRLYRGPGIGVGVPAALTSVSPFSVSGLGTVEGYAGASSDGLVNEATRTNLNGFIVVNNVGEIFTLSVDGERYIPQDGYVRIGDSTFRVKSIADNAITLVTVDLPGGSLLINDNVSVDVVQNAITANYDSNFSTTIRMHDVSGLLVGDTIYIGGSPDEAATPPVESYDFKATINAINEGARELTVTWQGTAPGFGNIFVEGEAVRKDYFGATTEGTETLNGNGDVIGGTQEGVNLPDTLAEGTVGESALFERTFGMAYSTFKDIYEAIGSSVDIPRADYSSGNGRSTRSYFNFQNVTYLVGDYHFTGSDAICGQGIVVVEGDLTINSTCPDGFRGIVYVTGEYSQAGNSVITGAVIAEGGTTTQIAGTGNPGNTDSSKIAYDPEEIFRQSQLLGPWRFEAIAGTWRQR